MSKTETQEISTVDVASVVITTKEPAKAKEKAKSVFESCMDFKNEDGVQMTKTIDVKEVTKGMWATIVAAYKELDRKTGEFGPTKFSLRRFKKVEGTYKLQSKFNLSSVKQAETIMGVLKDWANI